MSDPQAQVREAFIEGAMFGRAFLGRDIYTLDGQARSVAEAEALRRWPDEEAPHDEHKKKVAELRAAVTDARSKLAAAGDALDAADAAWDTAADEWHAARVAFAKEEVRRDMR